MGGYQQFDSGLALDLSSQIDLSNIARESVEVSPYIWELGRGEKWKKQAVR